MKENPLIRKIGPMTINYLKRDFHSLTPPESIIQIGAARFSVLTSRLIRMEYDPDNGRGSPTRCSGIGIFQRLTLKLIKTMIIS